MIVTISFCFIVPLTHEPALIQSYYAAKTHASVSALDNTRMRHGTQLARVANSSESGISHGADSRFYYAVHGINIIIR